VAIWTHGCINGIMLREVMSKLWPTLWKVCAERDHLPKGWKAGRLEGLALIPHQIPLDPLENLVAQHVCWGS